MESQKAEARHIYTKSQCASFAQPLSFMPSLWVSDTASNVSVLAKVGLTVSRLGGFGGADSECKEVRASGSVSWLLNRPFVAELVDRLSRLQCFLPSNLRISTLCMLVCACVCFVCACARVCVWHTKPLVSFLSPKILRLIFFNKNISLSHRHANIVL